MEKLIVTLGVNFNAPHAQGRIVSVIVPKLISTAKAHIEVLGEVKALKDDLAPYVDAAIAAIRAANETGLPQTFIDETGKPVVVIALDEGLFEVPLTNAH